MEPTQGSRFKKETGPCSSTLALALQKVMYLQPPWSQKMKTISNQQISLSDTRMHTNYYLGILEGTNFWYLWKTQMELEQSSSQSMWRLPERQRQPDATQEATSQLKMAEERLMIDISSVKSNEKKKIRKYWLLVVNKATNMKWSLFLSTKSAQVPLLIGFIKTLNEQWKDVKFIRCKNTGENESLQNKTKIKGLNVKPNSLQERPCNRMGRWKGLLQPFMAECDW